MTEDQIQAAVLRQLRYRHSDNLVYFAVPNGGYRDVVAGARLKSMGVRAGVSDLILLHDGQAFALELKTEKGRPTDAQHAFLSDWIAAGGKGHIAYGLDEALATLEAWGLIH